MATSPTPQQILDTLWPFLQVAATYARHLQVQIRAHPEKAGADNPFAAALTDADLSIQTLVEVAVLGKPCHDLVYIFGDLSRLQGPDISPHISSVSL